MVISWVCGSYGLHATLFVGLLEVCSLRGVAIALDQISIGCVSLCTKDVKIIFP